MLIGIDFDNTIVSYDTLFYRVAAEQKAVPSSIVRTKLAVRDHLRVTGKEDVWTEMQGYVYGARMAEAEAYPGVIDFMQWARESGIDLCIVSHKTKHPFIGPSYDLHTAARNWIEANLMAGTTPLVAKDRVYFELTKEEKIARIGQVQCDWFIDDLPEILQAPAFPHTVSCILFDPDRHHASMAGMRCMSAWVDIQQHFEQPCNLKP